MNQTLSALVDAWRTDAGSGPCGACGDACGTRLHVGHNRICGWCLDTLIQRAKELAGSDTDNARAMRGELRSYLDDVEPVECNSSPRREAP